MGEKLQKSAFCEPDSLQSGPSFYIIIQSGGTASRAQLAVILIRFFGDSFESEEIVSEEPSGEGGETEQTEGEETEETPAAEA